LFADDYNANTNAVIASVAKQFVSEDALIVTDCFVATLLAMTASGLVITVLGFAMMALLIAFVPFNL
jgi:4-hydroxybenzoate polyprenyltransferase